MLICLTIIEVKLRLLRYNRANFINLFIIMSMTRSKPNLAKSASKNTSAPNTGDQPVIAKPGVRIVAIVYDGMLILALLFLVGTVLTVIGTLMTMDTGSTSDQARSLPKWYQNFVLTPAFIVTLIGFYGIFWRRGGQTLGMQTWRLKTVNETGHYLTWLQSIKRILGACLVPLLCGIIGYLIHGTRAAILASAILGILFNYVFCLFNRRGLAVHDMLSNTITLKMPKIQHEGLLQSFRNRNKSAKK